jgi:hypothetical protein
MSKRPNSPAACATSFSVAGQSVTEKWSAIAPRGLDLGHDGLGRGLLSALPVQPDTWIVHHHRGAARGKREAVRTPQPAAAAGHDRDLAVEQAHGTSSVSPACRAGAIE